eukprot:TRINITY_DN18705_c0_g1_i1.p1 TRINITY_DN18705_c0_g1~~TRINITY_DN18705_c0_g1_i1.p1  ORF type:complete len:712 (+),score=309.47 TRINITY_DN18705_c0_g1_i1:23-2137(+)
MSKRLKDDSSDDDVADLDAGVESAEDEEGSIEGSEEEEIIEDSDEGSEDDEEMAANSDELDDTDVSRIVSGETAFQDDPSSDEEWDDPNKNTVGHIPMEYYDDYDHIGYNLKGEKIMKPVGAKKDGMDEFLAKNDDPNYWRTVYDAVNQRDVVLSRDEYDVINALMKSKFPDAYDPYEPFAEYDWEDSIHPVINRPPKKANFVPSKWEAQKVRKIVHAIRKGWIQFKEKKAEPPVPQLWADDHLVTDAQLRNSRLLFPAPKMKPPTHSESYHPPPEYLLTEEEKQAWENMDPSDRPTNYIPEQFDSLRKVPSYARFFRDRFERCLDLFLSPRATGKPKLNIDPESLIPKLPSPDELRPFPSTQSMIYEGHTGKVRSISVDPSGQYLASGAEDETVRIWEVETGRCIKQWSLGGTVFSVAWNPDPSRCVVAAAVGDTLFMLHAETLTDEENTAIDDTLFNSAIVPEVRAVVRLQTVTDAERASGIRWKISHDKTIKQISWHAKGDYLTAVCPDATAKAALVIHQLSTRKSQSPFRNLKGKVQFAQFHPTKPFLFVATQMYIKVYNLAKLRLEKKLVPGVKWISSFDIHPQGDNVIMGSYDKRVCWFDMDLSTKPYRVLRYHQLAVRKTVFHKHYPLFASCSDDLTIKVFHGMVYSDLLKNPLIVPLKVLRGPGAVDGLGVLDCQFHPIQPWLFASAADKTIRLYT